METASLKEKISTEGFAVMDAIYMDEEIERLIKAIANVDRPGDTVRSSQYLFAIRQFFKEVSRAREIIFNDRLITIIKELFGEGFFVVKSIYFDKPANSNWFVAWHQDLTIAVDKKLVMEGFGPWVTRPDQFSVQPPLPLLQDNFTLRVHLDNTNEDNGALKVIPGSHLKGIYRPGTIDWTQETENICCVDKGGIMFMKPLLLHSSSRTTNNNKRRVIHIEFSRSQLPAGLNWAEFMTLKPEELSKESSFK